MNSWILHCVILVNVWAALKASSQFFRNRFSLLLHQRKLPSTSILHHVWRFGKINGAFFLFWASLKKDEFAVYLFFPVMLGSEQFWGEISAKDLPPKNLFDKLFCDHLWNDISKKVVVHGTLQDIWPALHYWKIFQQNGISVKVVVVIK